MFFSKKKKKKEYVSKNWKRGQQQKKMLATKYTLNQENINLKFFKKDGFGF